MEEHMPAIMIVVCLVLIIGGPYGFRRDHDAKGPNVETPSAQVERAAQPEQEKP
jgi:hypothetical protein